MIIADSENAGTPGSGGARSSYDPEFFSHLAAIENEHFWFRTRNQIVAALAEQITKNLADGYKVLEVGCGTGNVLRALEQACPRGTVVGMDLFAEGLRFARTRTSCPLVQGNLEQPGFGVQFDLIGAFDVIEHLSDDVHIFRSIHAMLKPGGVLLLTVPAHQSLWSYFDEVSHHCRRYEPAGLRQTLELCGYEIEFLSEFMTAIFPLLYLVRRTGLVRHRLRGIDSAESDRDLAMRELRIVPFVNGILTFLLSHEAKLIERRWVLPFGTSIVAAVRRAK